VALEVVVCEWGMVGESNVCGGMGVCGCDVKLVESGCDGAFGAFGLL
jgi:hypothetical protein